MLVFLSLSLSRAPCPVGKIHSVIKGASFVIPEWETCEIALIRGGGGGRNSNDGQLSQPGKEGKQERDLIDSSVFRVPS